MNVFDFGLWVIGAVVVFIAAGAALLFVLAWASDKWDSRRHSSSDDEHTEGLTPPWRRGRR